ncbi:MAG: hypothetical protein M3Y57_08535 [Acidobacteriota bacterium]|nr:hypothetical protein [Acidobacteriota bacterium]
MREDATQDEKPFLLVDQLLRSLADGPQKRTDSVECCLHLGSFGVQAGDGQVICPLWVVCLPTGMTIAFATPESTVGLWYTSLNPVTLTALDSGGSGLSLVTGNANTDGTMGTSDSCPSATPEFHP